MPVINEKLAEFIRPRVPRFQAQIQTRLGTVLRNEVRSHVPKSVTAVEDLIRRLVTEVEFTGQRTIDLSDDLIPMFKRMLIETRRISVADTEELQERTHDPDILETLDAMLRPLDELMEQEWLRDVQPARIPSLTDYLPLKRIEDIQHSTAIMQERAYDQKFRILQAPGLIIDDLHFYRERCDLRGVPLAVAFIDVDDFKLNFNSKYGELVVDRRVLPVLMAKLEASVFNHGFAYRQGGDEFVLILPNMTFEVAAVYLDTVRRSVASLKFPQIPQQATISIGFALVDSDCFLTDREIVEKARMAKNFAKGTGNDTLDGKDRIATFKGIHFREDDLYIVIPSYPALSVQNE